MRRLTTLLALALCCAAFSALASAKDKDERDHHRPGKALSAVYCDWQFDEAFRVAKQLRGDERRAAEAAAKKTRDACRKKARTANQVEDVMPRMYPR